MSELIILGYDDHVTARRAYDKVLDLERDFIVELAGLALVRVDDDGEKHVDTPSNVVWASTASGALWGGGGAIFGLLFLVPGFGLLVGGALGALTGRLGRSGINRSFQDRVQGLLDPGKAAVVVMARKVTEDRFAAAMGDFGGTVLKTSLSEADERELAEELAG
ncbi:DUF1269 domain-containing protein [Georgenia satyanarayanai]|uniref:DUF1269 domain-containing protein n=1 Tax=Georgenia satyanarayanai TaxID=860221 RepID=UPI0020409488|nr:DUF1269 domain-containing protein [Georgenia satyanarayanai]MCM3660746.1 DUF1269 domain-containing protein [Georgenia satyanarayanai]